MKMIFSVKIATGDSLATLHAGRAEVERVLLELLDGALDAELVHLQLAGVLQAVDALDLFGHVAHLFVGEAVQVAASVQATVAGLRTRR